MLQINVDEFKSKCAEFSNFYDIDLKGELELWYSLWKGKNIATDAMKKMCMTDVLKEADTFFPSIEKAIHTSLAQPCTTCTVERSFSTLRRVKTWLRSTMTEDRLTGKNIGCMH